MKEFTNKFVDDLKNVFGDNLICVLLLGSVQKNDTTPFSDIDLVIIIKELNLKQIRSTRELIKGSERFIDLSFLCENEIAEDPNLFALGTHGCYQLGLILNNAECLFGENILLNKREPTEEAIRVSLVQKIIQYTWWIRRTFVESNRERSVASNYQINSRLIKMIKGLLHLSITADLHMDAEDSINLLIKCFQYLFNEDEIVVLKDLVNKEKISVNSANMSEEYFEIRFSIFNKIHKEALKYYYY